MSETYFINATTLGIMSTSGEVGWEDNHGLIDHDGTLFMVDDNGVYEVAGDDDDGFEIPWLIETGALTFKDEVNIKRCSEVRIFADTDNWFNVTVIIRDGGRPEEVSDEEGGTQLEYIHLGRAVLGSERKGQRIRIGRGLRSIDLGFRLSNKGGGDIKLRHLAAYISVGGPRN